MSKEIQQAKLKASALSNRDIAFKLDVISVLLNRGNYQQAMNEFELLKGQVNELGINIKTLLDVTNSN
jgi:hypothetical protein